MRGPGAPVGSGWLSAAFGNLCHRVEVRHETLSRAGTQLISCCRRPSQTLYVSPDPHLRAAPRRCLLGLAEEASLGRRLAALPPALVPCLGLDERTRDERGRTRRRTREEAVVLGKREQNSLADEAH